MTMHSYQLDNVYMPTAKGVLHREEKQSYFCDFILICQNCVSYARSFEICPCACLQKPDFPILSASSSSMMPFQYCRSRWVNRLGPLSSMPSSMKVVRSATGKRATSSGFNKNHNENKHGEGRWPASLQKFLVIFVFLPFSEVCTLKLIF